MRFLRSFFFAFFFFFALLGLGVVPALAAGRIQHLDAIALIPNAGSARRRPGAHEFLAPRGLLFDEKGGGPGMPLQPDKARFFYPAGRGE